MGSSRVDLYVHLVWATAHREPLLVGTAKRTALRTIEAETARMACKVVALNCMPDHVHLLVQVPSRLSVAELANRVKGVSSRMVGIETHPFAWQAGYGAFSVSDQLIATVADYIRRQEAHHGSGSVDAAQEAS